MASNIHGICFLVPNLDCCNFLGLFPHSYFVCCVHMYYAELRNSDVPASLSLLHTKVYTTEVKVKAPFFSNLTLLLSANNIPTLCRRLQKFYYLLLLFYNRYVHSLGYKV